ncbi:hypothetical protein EC844_11566 [Acinetobacter calcoaceticus]|uniref:DUF3649 domain-containing protein n=1 Tax=Acinetobacter calcoaceticus TaxID=471 RepID=A0A4V2R0M0_ACICA|nr:hypothetical protein EC844_11566 [Acinetobacter calcoaceticus]
MSMNNVANANVATTAEIHSVPRAKKSKKQVTAISYRVMIFYRFGLALLGGYLLAALSAMMIAALFSADRINAVMAATLTAFVIHCGVFIWVFMVNKTLKASLGVLTPCVILFGLLQWMAQ